MLTDWNVSPATAGATAGLIGFAAIGGRLIIGALLDRSPPLRVTAGVFILIACGLVVLAATGPRFARAAALVLGCGVGAEADLMAFLIARYFPKAQYGQVYGAMYAVFLAGGAIGPAASGYLQQATGDYRFSLYAAAGALVLGAAAAALFARTSHPGQ